MSPAQNKITDKDIAWALFDCHVISYSDLDKFFSGEYSPLVESIVQAFRKLEALGDKNESVD